MKLAKYVILLGLLSVMSCATFQEGQVREGLDSWKGKDYHQLMATMGPPQQESNDNQGGRVLIYTRAETRVIPGVAIVPYSVTAPNLMTTPTQGTPGRVRTTIEEKKFWVDAKGKIYRTAYQKE